MGGVRMYIRTERLELRPIVEGDREAMCALLTDDIIKQTYMLPDFPDADALERMFLRLCVLSEDESRFVAGIALNGGLIGFMNDVGMENGCIELGYVIHPAHHNCGYATEALRAAIGALFEKGFVRVEAGAFEGNTASLRVMEKCGMEKIDKTEPIEYRGKIYRCVYRAIERK